MIPHFTSKDDNYAVALNSFQPGILIQISEKRDQARIAMSSTQARELAALLIETADQSDNQHQKS